MVGWKHPSSPFPVRPVECRSFVCQHCSGLGARRPRAAAAAAGARCLVHCVSFITAPPGSLSVIVPALADVVDSRGPNLRCLAARRTPGERSKSALVDAEGFYALPMKLRYAAAFAAAPLSQALSQLALLLPEPPSSCAPSPSRSTRQSSTATGART